MQLAGGGREHDIHLLRRRVPDSVLLEPFPDLLARHFEGDSRERERTASDLCVKCAQVGSVRAGSEVCGDLVAVVSSGEMKLAGRRSGFSLHGRRGGQASRALDDDGHALRNGRRRLSGSVRFEHESQ